MRHWSYTLERELDAQGWSQLPTYTPLAAVLSRRKQLSWSKRSALVSKANHNEILWFHKCQPFKTCRVFWIISLAPNFCYIKWHNGISCKREIPALTEPRCDRHVMCHQHRKGTVSPMWVLMWHASLWSLPNLLSNLTQRFQQSYSKFPYVSPNLLIILEDDRRSYPPCSLGSALGWLFATAVNVSTLVIEPCCILSKGWPQGEAQKGHNNSCMSAPGLLPVQDKAEQLKAPLEIMSSCRLLQINIWLLSKFMHGWLSAHQYTKKALKVGRQTPGGRGFLVYLQKCILSAGQGLNVCI